MQDIFLIGGSPSSGSTLLVNMLNKNRNLVCLPETGLFVHGRNLLELSSKSVSDDLSWYLPWVLTSVKIEKALGWSKSEYESSLKKSRTAFDLLRDRVDPDRDYYLIEKTPENIFSFERYLAQSEENRVIITSRDALSVVQSLVRRGFTLMEGLLIWFSHSYESAKIILRYPSQVFHCSYARLTQEPLKVTKEVVDFLGITNDSLLNDRKSSDLHGKKYINNEKSNLESLKMMLEISSWSLADTSWSMSPNGKALYKNPVNLIGIEYDVMFNKIKFKTPSGGILSPGVLDSFLSDKKKELRYESGIKFKAVEVEHNSSYTECLAKHYRPVFQVYS